MPGKVNPVIPEVVNQVAFAIVGADVSIAFASEAGQLQLNAFEPIIAHSLLQSIGWLTNGVRVLRDLCVSGIEANRELLAERAATSIGAITSLVPEIGYDTAARAAEHALAEGVPIGEAVAHVSGLTRREAERLLALS